MRDGPVWDTYKGLGFIALGAGLAGYCCSVQLRMTPFF